MPVRTSTISSNSLLVVHGKGFKPPAEALSDVCAAALRAGVQRDYPEHADKFDKVALHMAYYGDLTNEFLLGQGREYDHQVDLADRQNALSELRAIDARKKFGIRQYDCRPGKSAVPEFFANFVAPLAGVLGLTKSLVRRLSPATPGPRAEAASAYDPVRDLVVLFGGYRSSEGRVQRLSDTWE